MQNREKGKQHHDSAGHHRQKRGTEQVLGFEICRLHASVLKLRDTVAHKDVVSVKERGEHMGQVLHHNIPADLGGARVISAIDESWGEEKVHVVAEIQPEFLKVNSCAVLQLDHGYDSGSIVANKRVYFHHQSHLLAPDNEARRRWQMVVQRCGTGPHEEKHLITDVKDEVNRMSAETTESPQTEEREDTESLEKHESPDGGGGSNLPKGPRHQLEIESF